MKTRSRILAGTALGVLMASAPLVASAGDYGRPEPSLSGDMTSAQPRYLAQAEGGDEQSGEQVLKKKRKHREPAPGPASNSPLPSKLRRNRWLPSRRLHKRSLHRRRFRKSSSRWRETGKAQAKAASSSGTACRDRSRAGACTSGRSTEGGSRKSSSRWRETGKAQAKAASSSGTACRDGSRAGACTSGRSTEGGSRKSSSRWRETGKAQAKAAGSSGTACRDRSRPGACTSGRSTEGRSRKGSPAARNRRSRTKASSRLRQRSPGQSLNRPRSPRLRWPNSRLSRSSNQDSRARLRLRRDRRRCWTARSTPRQKASKLRSGSDESQQAQPAEPTSPPPADDRAAQQKVQPARIQPVTAEQGTRIDLRPEQAARRVRPQGVEVVREFGERTIVQINNQIIVRKQRPAAHVARRARRLLRGPAARPRTRGHHPGERQPRRHDPQPLRRHHPPLAHRADGREYVLVYVDERYYERRRRLARSGLDLPPMRLTIPSRGIHPRRRIRGGSGRPTTTSSNSRRSNGSSALYSVDEVKRSARIRDKARRVDLDTVTFEFGSASIAESEIPKLEGVAEAMEKLLEQRTRRRPS